MRLHQLTFAALLLAGMAAVPACATTDPITSPGDGGSGGSGLPSDICILQNCGSDAECAGCAEGRTTCDLAQRRCVACGPDMACPEGLECTEFGDCVPIGASCPTDEHGLPIVACTTNEECAACDPLHQVCDPVSSMCVSCSEADTSACQATDICVDGLCSPKCPTGCQNDNDCAQCGGEGSPVHACNEGICAECSPTYACAAGQVCTPQGTCVIACGSDNMGTCTTDEQCAGCGAGDQVCQKAMNAAVGQCGPPVAGCADLVQGTSVLPDPWGPSTELCMNDMECAGVSAPLNVGGVLRDMTGIADIQDATLDYGMNACVQVAIDPMTTCGVCAPCREDADCSPVDVDALAPQMFAGLTAQQKAYVLDQVFGQNPHTAYMYCQPLGAGYGVCSICSGIYQDCTQAPPPPPMCAHDECLEGAMLDPGCSTCAGDVCAVDPYCCDTEWDYICVGEVALYCSITC